MDATLRRRRFLQSASALGLGAGLGDWALLRTVTPAGAAAMAVGPDAVRFRPEIEPVVRWIEETPRDRILDVAVDHLKNGLSYRDLLAGLFLAGIRNIKPHPVGFKFHAVMVINSAHLLGQTAVGRRPPAAAALGARHLQEVAGAGRQGRRLDARQGRRVPPAPAATRPGPSSSARWRPGTPTRPTPRSPPSAGPPARPRRWSRSGGWPSATSATSATSRSSPRRAGGPCRRSAGSTPSPSSARSPSACSTSTATPATSPSAPTRRTSRTPRRSATTGRPASPTPPPPAPCSRRSARPSPEDASAEAAKLLNQGVSPDSLWDAVVLSGSELMMRSPGIVAIHATTSANALHYIYSASGDDTTRKLALLQAVGWQPALPRPGQAHRRRRRSTRSNRPSPTPRATRPSARSSTTVSNDRGEAAAQGPRLPRRRRLARPRSSPPPAG